MYSQKATVKFAQRFKSLSQNETVACACGERKTEATK